MNCAGGRAGDVIADTGETDSQQVDFLNSVIVDQLRKIEELNRKVKLLAEVGDTDPNGYDLDFR